MITSTRIEVTPDELKAAVRAWLKERGIEVPHTARVRTIVGDELSSLVVDMPTTFPGLKEPA